MTGPPEAEGVRVEGQRKDQGPEAGPERGRVTVKGTQEEVEKRRKVGHDRVQRSGGGLPSEYCSLEIGRAHV